MILREWNRNTRFSANERLLIGGHWSNSIRQSTLDKKVYESSKSTKFANYSLKCAFNLLRFHR